MTTSLTLVMCDGCIDDSDDVNVVKHLGWKPVAQAHGVWVHLGQSVDESRELYRQISRK